MEDDIIIDSLFVTLVTKMPRYVLFAIHSGDQYLVLQSDDDNCYLPLFKLPKPTMLLDANIKYFPFQICRYMKDILLWIFDDFGEIGYEFGRSIAHQKILVIEIDIGSNVVPKKNHTHSFRFEPYDDLATIYDKTYEYYWGRQLGDWPDHKK